MSVGGLNTITRRVNPTRLDDRFLAKAIGVRFARNQKSQNTCPRVLMERVDAAVV
jgi:hypothetical protein